MLSKLQIDFYGSGSPKYVNTLKKISSDAGISEIVNFYNYRADIYDIICNYNIGINFSLEEGFGRVAVEYMAAGLCPMVSASGANVELVEDKVTGLLINRSSVKDLENNLRYISDFPEKIKLMAENAHTKVKSNYTISKHTQDIFNLYEEILYNDGNGLK